MTGVCQATVPVVLSCTPAPLPVPATCVWEKVRPERLKPVLVVPSLVWVINPAVVESESAVPAETLASLAEYSVQSAGAGWPVVLAVCVFQLVCVQV